MEVANDEKETACTGFSTDLYDRGYMHLLLRQHHIYRLCEGVDQTSGLWRIDSYV